MEASQREGDVLPENGSFGYLYEVLITSALNSTISTKAQLEKKYTFLSLLAFHMFQSSSNILSVSATEHLLDAYSEDYKVKVDKKALLADLEYARVLEKQDGNYAFLYPHFYQYFLARYFKNQINSPQGVELRKRLEDIATGVNIHANRTFLMFFIYMTHDEPLTDFIIALGQKVLDDVTESNLTDEVDFYNSKDFVGVGTQPIPESVDLEVSRRDRREREDRVQKPVTDLDAGWNIHVPDNPYSSTMSVSDKLSYADSCVEVLGQILRNFTGSLPGDRKLLILDATYRLGLRNLHAILRLLSEATIFVRESLAKVNPKTDAEKRFVKSIQRFLLVVGQLVGTSTFHNLSLSIGSPDIEETAYEEVLERVGRTNATELINLAIKLDHFEGYPVEDIRRLHRQFAANRFADDALKGLVISHMHVFHISRETRQKVLAIWGRTPDDGMLVRATKRFKESITEQDSEKH